MFDVVYSIICHESLLCIEDLIKNATKFNKGWKVLFILNINHHLRSLMSQERETKWKVKNGKITWEGYDDLKVLINPNIFDKKTYNSSLLIAHMSNFEYVDSQVDFRYFCTMASNCMFVTNIKIKDIEDYYSNKNLTPGEYKGDYEYNPDWWCHWPIFDKNQKIVDIFKEKNIRPIKGRIEGAFYPRIMFLNICMKIKELKLLDKITQETVFEEILPPTFEMYLFNFKVLRICRGDFINPSVTRNYIKEVLAHDDTYCIVKRVIRRIDDPIRKYINTL